MTVTPKPPMFGTVPTNPSFPELELQTLRWWQERRIFERSLEQTADGPRFTFYEGPPTANGMPGIHHVEARSLKDLFPRFKTMQGYFVGRKAGWDTHGLPVEIAVEKKLGLNSKREVEAYGIDKFNEQCRETVFEYEHEWRRFTERMAYWVDLDRPYMTLQRNYIESIWWSVQQLDQKGLLYKGFRVAPYCPKDGTTLSNAEVSEGYKDIQDPSVYVPFRLTDPAALDLPDHTAFLVWTTTPWTLPYNVGVAIHPDLEYVAARDKDGRVLILAASLRAEVLGEDAEIVRTFRGSELERVAYEPLFTEAYEAEGEGKTVWMSGLDTYVSDKDGTGIVHTAPAFGEDDMRLARNYGFPVIVGVDTEGKHRFGPWKGVFFRDANTEIVRDLRARGLMWKEKNFLHSYPHCWRCGTPLMYYATESWYLNNTRLKDRLIELNGTIDWHPAHIRTGRYGGWLENLIDWNISRSRYWGTPLPVWEAEDGEYRVIGSYAELAELSGRPEVTGESFDPHRPYVDDITFEADGKTFRRVPYVMDVWYDSGSMPFAQHHYPFENKELFEQGGFPADYISEAIDQTRGWFNSLHQIGTMVFDSVAYKSVICAGHFLDEKGQKMSKSKGNILDPWEVFNTYGADAARWYTYVSAPPELSRRVGLNVIGESFRSYFMTLWNTYSFFVLYANLDQPDLRAAPPVEERPEVDRWLIAKVQALVGTVTGALNNYDPTGSSRALQDFVVEDLSNWYVRRNRRRFWSGDGQVDLSAYATLHYALVTVTQLTAPFTPFLAESLYQNLVRSVTPDAPESVHLATWPQVDEALAAPSLVGEMDAVLRVVSLGRAVRGQTGMRQRQPLPKVMLRARSAEQTAALGRFVEQIKEELNVKEVELLDQYAELVSYQLRPNLPLLGKKFGKAVPQVRAALQEADASEVARFVRDGKFFEVVAPTGERFELGPDEVLVDARSPEGFAAQEEAGYLVAFDTQLTRELELEGLARDLVRGIQDGRKKAGFEVSDRITLHLDLTGDAREAAEAWQEYLMSETLTESLVFGAAEGFAAEVEGGTAYLERLERDGSMAGA
ncbi:isoleucine--tRNA ligase [Deinococcus deserti]|uniref:Isoleucine--tRNA ligase n=1 Tax=Deinococcus deserti (strain DSM 17065 / CIP 109153 / LMG 22923 / VCD115) TaxID=546414 RepID=C1CV55_DEIDV|nr:isoleucine--tRNA ligase [Deinococcus deserti]ACO46072.1 putative isoleucine--tRNA ligase (isoleucyl-tRNA synthetase) [Deinococcus deserti VCD115]